MMIRYLTVTFNAGPDRLLQVPLPDLSMADAERLVLNAPNSIPQVLARQAPCGSLVVIAPAAQVFAGSGSR